MPRSATVPTAGQSEADVLDARAQSWRDRPLLRDIYHRYFAEMVAHLAPLSQAKTPSHHPSPLLPSFGLIVEIGGGSGNFKEYFRAHHPGRGTLLATDIVPTPHCDLAADALRLPFPDGSIDNLLMMDVLHHLPYPLRFFTEARRVLRPGGRVVLTEPYISPASRAVFKLAHPEPVHMRAHLFPDPPSAIENRKSKIENPLPSDPPAFTGTGAFASNQGIPTLLFGRDFRRFQERFPDLALVTLARRSVFMYPLSGGFSGPCLLPRFAQPLGWACERLLQPLSRLLAFRLLIVLQRGG